MFFSILIPVYNTEKYLSKCIDSVCKQSFTDYEIILVDDGSTDSSGKICDEYANNNPKIMAFHNKNHGLLYTRRFALAKAKGDYIFNLDSDDSMKEGALEILHEKLSNNDIDCLIYNFDRITNSKIIYSSTTNSLNGYYLKNDEILLKLLSDDAFNSLGRKVTKRCLIGKWDYSNYYSVQIGEDLLQSLEIYNESSNFYFLNESLYNYYVNPESLVQSINYEDYKLDYSVRKTIMDYIKMNKLLTDKAIKSIKNHYARLLAIDVIKIGYFDTSYRNRRRLIKEIRESNYFNEVLNVRYISLLKYKDKSFIYSCLYMKMYDFIIAICSLRKIANKRIHI